MLPGVILYVVAFMTRTPLQESFLYPYNFVPTELGIRMCSKLRRPGSELISDAAEAAATWKSRNTRTRSFPTGSAGLDLHLP